MSLPLIASCPMSLASQNVLAIGAGPSNLSLAALADPISGLNIKVFERADQIRWHAGMQLPDAELQVSCLKDLVTLVDPTSRYSFLSFLKAEKRIYRALVANRDYTSRLEFERYLKWVAALLPDVRMNTDVYAIGHDDDGIWLETSQGRHRGDHVVVGVGRVPKVPDVLGAKNAGWHAAQYIFRSAGTSFAGKRVAVIGGGQSGAEIVSDLLRRHGGDIRILWVCKRMNLLPLDDTPFINEQFFPNYTPFTSGSENPEVR